MRLIAPALVLALAAARTGSVSAADTANGPDGAVLAAAAKSVVQVIARDCTGEEGDRAGSGFILAGGSLIVTDLHVVAGCTNLTVKYQGIDVLPATVKGVLRDRDLALLQVEHAPPLPGLALSAGEPAVNQELDVIGFPLGLPALDSTMLHVGLATVTSPELRDALRDQEVKELASIGFPALNTHVIRVDGNLLPGDSGAPLINGQGKVAGIGSGGLEKGTVGIGWAMQPQYVQDLLAQKAAPAAADTGTTALATTAFAAALPASTQADPSHVVKCGQMTLVRRQETTFGALARTADNVVSVEALATEMSGITLSDISRDRVTVWTEPVSGAGITVPAGLRLEPQPNGCIVRTRAPSISYFISLSPLPLDAASPAWELAANRMAWTGLHDIIGLAGATALQGDPAHAGLKSRIVQNGGSIIRSTLIGTAHDGNPVRVFRNEMAGRGAAIAYYVIDRDARAQPADVGRQARAAWVRGVLAVDFAAFPPLTDTAATATEPPAAATHAGLLLMGRRTYPHIRCGEAALIADPAQVTLADRLAGVPDEAATATLVRQATGIDPADLPADALDAWVQPARGATVLLPRGVAPRPDPAACHIQSAAASVAYSLRVVVARADVADWPRRAAEVASEFMRALKARTGFTAGRPRARPIHYKVPPNGVVASRVIAGRGADGNRVLIALAALRRDRVLTLFAMTDTDAASTDKAARAQRALGLLAVRLATLMK